MKSRLGCLGLGRDPLCLSLPFTQHLFPSHTHIHTSSHMCHNMHTHTRTYAHTNTGCTHTHTCTYMHTQVNMETHTHTDYTCICTHTHTHTTPSRQAQANIYPQARVPCTLSPPWSRTKPDLNPGKSPNTHTGRLPGGRIQLLVIPGLWPLMAEALWKQHAGK